MNFRGRQCLYTDTKQITTNNHSTTTGRIHRILRRDFFCFRTSYESEDIILLYKYEFTLSDTRYREIRRNI